MSVHPEVITPGVTTGHVVVSEESAVEWNRREIMVPCVVDGTTLNTSMIEDYIDEAEPGDLLRFPRGPIATAPFVVPKLLRLRGAGRFGTRFVPLSDTSSPIIDFDVPAPGDIWATYGAGVESLGINLAAAPSATGIRTASTAGWVELDKLAIVGGALSLDNRGANALLSNFLFADATRFLLIDGDSGMEMIVSDGALARNTAGTTTLGIEVVCDSAVGAKGALNMANVRCTSGTTGGVETDQWLKMSAPSAISLPLFATNVQFDNCIGGGPGMEFVNVYDINFKSWANNGHASAGPAVRINGGGRYSFDGTFFGGGSPAKTFDLLGTIAGLKIAGTTPTEKVVYFNPGCTLTDLDFQATVPGATALSQVTNDEAAFRAAAIKNWGYSNIYQPPGIGPTFVNSWANVLGTQAYYVKDSNATVHVAGLVSGGVAQTIFTLPAGYRPAYTEHFAGVLDNGSTVVIEVLNTGVVKAYTTFPSPTVAISFSFRWGGG